MSEQEKEYRLKYIEERITLNEKKIRDVEEMSKEFTKIATILEMQIDMNKKQDETLIKINDNLTSLNHTTTILGERVNDLETEVKDVNKRDNISMSTLIRRVGWTVLSITIGVVLSAVYGLIG